MCDLWLDSVYLDLYLFAGFNGSDFGIRRIQLMCDLWLDSVYLDLYLSLDSIF